MGADSNIGHPDDDFDASFLLVGMIWLLAGAGTVNGLWKLTVAEPPIISPGAVNPNTAPWWELTVLPDIGPAIARRIVALREARESGEQPARIVFRSPGDLDAVPGIGPKTVRRIASELRFNRGNAPQADHAGGE